MKISGKTILVLALVASCAFITVMADEDDEAEAEVDDVEVEADDEAEVEEEPIDEVAVAEQATGIIDPSNHPGRIISRKKILSKHPAAGQPMEMEYTIWNVGNSAVSDVELVDDSYSTEEYTEAVKVTIKVDSIEAGAKHVETHLVTPKAEGKIKLAGAKVTSSLLSLPIPTISSSTSLTEPAKASYQWQLLLTMLVTSKAIYSTGYALAYSPFQAQCCLTSLPRAHSHATAKPNLHRDFFGFTGQ